MFSFGIALAVSLLISLFALRWAHLHAHLTLDPSTDETRKVHVRAVPRIGGLGVFLAVIVGALAIELREPLVGQPILALVACALPAFAAGLGEDVTKRVSPRARMFWIAVSCVLAWWALDLAIARVDFAWGDRLLAFTPLAVAFTVFGLLTITNAINLIDGLNGLAGVVCAVMFGALAIVGFKVGDAFIVSCSLMMAGSICGFLFWNYPRGHIFLGDGGAYFLGFMLGALSILLVGRNAAVSAWFPVLLLAYPLFEVTFSIWRRKFVRGAHVGTPDAAHLHHLIYRRVVRWAIGSSGRDRRTWRNAMTAPYLWVLSSLAVMPAIVFYDRTAILVGFCVVFVITYVWLYLRIVRLRVPRWLVLRIRR